VAAASDDQRVGVTGGVDEGGPGVTLDHLTGDPERAVTMMHRGQSVVKKASHVRRGVVIVGDSVAYMLGKCHAATTTRADPVKSACRAAHQCGERGRRAVYAGADSRPLRFICAHH
jgi:hypothetical protein